MENKVYTLYCIYIIITGTPTLIGVLGSFLIALSKWRTYPCGSTPISVMS